MPDPTPDAAPDWVRAQREWLRPIVVGRLGIHPPWLDPVGEVPVSIDPGPTFGHGAHPTTSLVLVEVDRLAGPGTSVLDVGCGSGILGIAAARLGSGPVVSIDVEADAVAWTLTNASANEVEVSASTLPLSDLPLGDPPIEDLPFGNGPLGNRPGTFDLVLANVLPVVHEAIAPAVVARVSEAGTLVISGIPDEHADRVAGLYVAGGPRAGRAAERAAGLTEVRRTSSGHWSAIVLERRTH
jgi:ribosomal protein L11 methyltransferase